MKTWVWVILLAGVGFLARAYFREPSWDQQFRENPQQALANVAAQFNRERGQGADGVRFVGAEAQGANLLTLTIQHQNVNSSQAGNRQLAAYSAEMVNRLCASEKFDILLRNKVTVKYRVLANDGEVLFVERASERSCATQRAVPVATAEAPPPPSSSAQMKCGAITDQESHDACVEHWSGR